MSGLEYVVAAAYVAAFREDRWICEIIERDGDDRLRFVGERREREDPRAVARVDEPAAPLARRAVAAGKAN